MTDMTCPNCSGTGYTQDAAGENVVCPLCDGTGVLVTDEGDTGTV
jgi:DnaJ-class molecular chaperone